MLKQISVLGKTLNRSELLTVNGGGIPNDLCPKGDCRDLNGNPDDKVGNRYQ